MDAITGFVGQIVLWVGATRPKATHRIVNMYHACGVLNAVLTGAVLVRAPLNCEAFADGQTTVHIVHTLSDSPFQICSACKSVPSKISDFSLYYCAFQ